MIVLIFKVVVLGIIGALAVYALVLAVMAMISDEPGL